MIAAMVSGTLAGDPLERASAKGTRYATASVRCSVGTESIFIGVAAFDDDVIARLMRLSKGSPITAAGKLELNAWTDREGRERRDWRLTASEILSPYQAKKRRSSEEGGE